MNFPIEQEQNKCTSYAEHEKSKETKDFLLFQK